MVNGQYLITSEYFHHPVSVLFHQVPPEVTVAFFRVDTANKTYVITIYISSATFAISTFFNQQLRNRISSFWTNRKCTSPVTDITHQE